jgi:hypothetical protein
LHSVVILQSLWVAEISFVVMTDHCGACLLCNNAELE